MNQNPCIDIPSPGAGHQNEFQVCIAGKLDHISKGYSFGPFMRDFYVIDYCTRGGFTVHTEEQAIPICQGELHVIPPNTGIRMEYTADVTSSIYVGVKGIRLAHCLKRLGFSERNIIFPHRLTRQALEYFNLLVDSLEICEHQSNEADPNLHKVTFHPNSHYSNHLSLEAELRQTAWFSLFLAELANIRGSSLPEPTKEPLQEAYINAAMRYIDRNYHLDITVDGIASYVGLTRSYLFKLFREHLGISIQDYIIRTRMQAACDFLKLPDAQVKTVAASVGYEACSFSKMFKKVVGMPPGEYQEKNSWPQDPGCTANE